MQNQSANPRNVVSAPTACGGAVPGAQGQFSAGRLRASFRVNDAAGWMSFAILQSHLEGDTGAQELLNASLEIADD